MEQRFELGALVATPAALAACGEATISPSELFERHASGDCYRTLWAQPVKIRAHALREIFNAIFYVLKSDCLWRLLPHDFPPWSSYVR